MDYQNARTEVPNASESAIGENGEGTPLDAEFDSLEVIFDLALTFVFIAPHWLLTLLRLHLMEYWHLSVQSPLSLYLTHSRCLMRLIWIVLFKLNGSLHLWASLSFELFLTSLPFLLQKLPIVLCRLNLHLLVLFQLHYLRFVLAHTITHMWVRMPYPGSLRIQWLLILSRHSVKEFLSAVKVHWPNCGWLDLRVLLNWLLISAQVASQGSLHIAVKGVWLAWCLATETTTRLH